MLEVDIPSFLFPRTPSAAAKPDGHQHDDAGGCDGSEAARTLTCALAGLANLLVFAFVSLLGACGVLGCLCA